MAAWQEIYHKLDPKEPLDPDDKRLEKDLYTNDFFTAVKDTLLLNKELNYKLLLSGHTGSGKSTFLNIVSDDAAVKSNFHIVKYSMRDFLDTNDIDYIDLLLSIAVKTITSLPDRAFGGSGLLAKAEDLAKLLQGIITREVTDEKSERGEIGGSVDAGLGFLDYFKTKFFAKYKLEDQTREVIRRHYRARITDFISLIDSIIAGTEINVSKKVLILIDDTDKIPPDKGIEVFFNNGHHIAAPKTNIVFVIDVSLSTSSRYKAISPKFSGEEFFPAVKIVEKGGATSEITKRNIGMLKELVYKRIPRELISDDALEKAIEYSGGVVRELVRLLNYSLFNAKGGIHIDNVEFARYKIANEFNLYGKHTKILKNVADDPEWISREDAVEDENTILELLHMSVLFQYRNGTIKWYRPYPIFIEWLNKLYKNDVLSKAGQ